MTHFKFEGDISDISANQIEYICSVLEERGFANGKVSVESVGQAGDNYVANVKRITIEKDVVRFRMIAKIAPTHEVRRAIMNALYNFQNEHVMYTEVLPKFSELERIADIPENERLRYAACYGSYTEEPNEVILLEDLNKSDYVMLDRFVSLTDDTVKLVLKNFAILHSLSYALKNREPETYVGIKNKLHNVSVLMEHAPGVKLYLESVENDLLELLDTEKYKKFIKGTVSQIPTHALKCLKDDSKSKYSVINQGDPWTNNFLFRLHGDKAGSCCMIDYQESKESSPVADLQFMIFNCTDYETRSRHYHEWIDYYHDQLNKCLDNFGLKGNFIYPRDQLDADLRRHGKLSLSTSALQASLLTRQSTDLIFQTAFQDDLQIEDLMKTAKISATDNETVLRFKSRVQELIDSFVQLGYL